MGEWWDRGLMARRGWLLELCNVVIERGVDVERIGDDGVVMLRAGRLGG